MAIKLNLEYMTEESVNTAIAEAAEFKGYTGPTPPPDVYNVKAKKLWYSQTKTGKDVLKALFTISETGDKETYNGASIFYNMLIPASREDKGYSIQVSRLNDFLLAISDGKFGMNDFSKAATAGKIINGKKEKAGEPIVSIGKLKFTVDKEITVKTGIREYNGTEYLDLKDIIVPVAKKAEEDTESDEDFDFGDDEFDD